MAEEHVEPVPLPAHDVLSHILLGMKEQIKL